MFGCRPSGDERFLCNAHKLSSCVSFAFFQNPAVSAPRLVGNSLRRRLTLCLHGKRSLVRGEAPPESLVDSLPLPRGAGRGRGARAPSAPHFLPLLTP